MKKTISVLLFTFLLVCMVATTSFAAGESGNVYAGPNYKNLILQPADGKNFSSDSLISWKASGTFYNKGLGGVFQDVWGWFSDDFSVHKISMEIYTVTESNEWYSNEEFYSTVFTKTYDHKATVDFSESGTVRLPEGKYEFVLKVGYTGLLGTTSESKVKSSAITVYKSSSTGSSTQQQTKYGKVAVIYKLTNGDIIKTEEKHLAPGTHYIHNEYPMDDSLELIGTQYHYIEVSSDGSVSDSSVEFILKWDALENKNNSNTGTTVDPIPPQDSDTFTVIGEYCRIDDPGANVRSGPGTEYEKIGTAPNNGYYRIVDYDRVNTKKDWYQIDRDGLYCWIYSDLVDLNGNLDGTQDGVPMGIINGTTGGTSSSWPIGVWCYMRDDGNNVRSGPGTEYSVVGVANAGDSFKILDSRMGSTGKDWYQIQLPNGTYGWISSGIVDVR